MRWVTPHADWPKDQRARSHGHQPRPVHSKQTSGIACGLTMGPLVSTPPAREARAALASTLTAAARASAATLPRAGRGATRGSWCMSPSLVSRLAATAASLGAPAPRSAAVAAASCRKLPFVLVRSRRRPQGAAPCPSGPNLLRPDHAEHSGGGPGGHDGVVQELPRLAVHERQDGVPPEPQDGLHVAQVRLEGLIGKRT